MQTYRTFELRALLALLSVSSSILAQSQGVIPPAKEFVAQATVEFADGSKLELTEFRFHPDYAELVAKASVLGTSGEFTILLQALKTITSDPDKPGSYVITDQEGTRTVVSDPRFIFRGGFPPTYSGVEEELKISVGRTQVAVQPRLIESLVFPSEATGRDQVKIRMKKGDEAQGTLENITHLSGKTDAGKLVIVALGPRTKEAVRAIRFH